jgi:xylulose-5-phosphate/fructose-6-phosphate phosphoketolase
MARGNVITVSICYGNADEQYVVDSLPKKGAKEKRLIQQMKDKLIEHRKYVTLHGEDMPEVQNWRWSIW